MSNVLVLSAGRRVSLVRGFQDAARQRSGVRVLAADANPRLSAACAVADAAFEVPRVSAPDYAEALLDLCKRENVGLVVPTIDPELGALADMRERLQALGASALACDRPLIDAFADKRSTKTFFDRVGLETAALYSKDAIRYPTFVKPYDGSLSAGAMLVRAPEDMPPSALANEKNLFCEYVDHKTHDEFTCDLYFDRSGGLRCVVPRQRLEVRGGEVSKAKAVKNDVVTRLFEVFGRLDGARGPLTLQLFRHAQTGRMVFNEINPRFGGGYPLTRRAGADFQAWLIAEHLFDEPVETFHDWRDGLIMLRYDDEIVVEPDAAQDAAPDSAHG